MQVYYDKIEKVRKEKKINLDDICKTIDITRVTYWKWKKGKSFPSEMKIRQIAKTLKMSVQDISDLHPEKDISDENMVDRLDTWLDLASIHDQQRKNEHELFLRLLKKHQHEFFQSKMLVNSITSSTDFPLYIKDISQNIIFANDPFKELIGFNKFKKVEGLNEYSFFPTREAKENSDFDFEVLSTGEAKKYETYLPNSRKKKWCIVIKSPINDHRGKIAGVVSTYIDITERRQKEIINDLLIKSMEESGQVFFLRNARWNKYLYISKAVEDLYGYPLERFYNEEEFWQNKILHPDMLQEDIEFRKRTDSPRAIKAKMVSASGEVFFVEAKVFQTNEYVLIVEKKLDS